MTIFLAAAQPAVAAADHSPNVTDWLTGIGTVATAVLAIVGVAVTIVLAVKERSRARTELKLAQTRYETERDAAAARFEEERERYRADVQRAEAQLAAERERAEAQRVREFVLASLETAAEQYARWHASPSQHPGPEAMRRLRMLGRTLPDGVAPMLKHALGLVDGPKDQQLVQELLLEHGGSLPTPIPEEWIFADLAKSAKEIVGLPAS